MRLIVTKTVPVPADFAWQKLGREFAQIADFFSQVDHSRPITRSEMPVGYHEIPGAPVLGRYTESRVIKATEVLTEYSDADRCFAFDAVDVPVFLLSKSQNTTRVIAVDGGQCRVEIVVEMGLRHVFNILSPVLRKRMTRLFTKLINEVAASHPDAP